MKFIVLALPVLSFCKGFEGIKTGLFKKSNMTCYFSLCKLM
jgi:hypothetical protein